jgi:hypothetical protein
MGEEKVRWFERNRGRLRGSRAEASCAFALEIAEESASGDWRGEPDPSDAGETPRRGCGLGRRVREVLGLI